MKSLQSILTLIYRANKHMRVLCASTACRKHARKSKVHWRFVLFLVQLTKYDTGMTPLFYHSLWIAECKARSWGFSRVSPRPCRCQWFLQDFSIMLFVTNMLINIRRSFSSMLNLTRKLYHFVFVVPDDCTFIEIYKLHIFGKKKQQFLMFWVTILTWSRYTLKYIL